MQVLGNSVCYLKDNNSISMGGIVGRQKYFWGYYCNLNIGHCVCIQQSRDICSGFRQHSISFRVLVIF